MTAPIIYDLRNDVERQLTDDLAIAYKAAFRAAGYRADRERTNP